MAQAIKSNAGTGYLQTMLRKKLLPNYESSLFFAKLGEKPMIDNGVGTISWARASKLTINSTAATITEGVTPTNTSFNYSTISATPTQYGLYVEVSDRLIKAAPTKILTDASKEVGNNLARIVDQVVQTEIMAGTNVLYADTKVARTGLTATSVLVANDVKKAVVKLRGEDAPTIDGTYYLSVLHPFVEGDLRGETNGAYIEFSKYTTADKLFKGEIGALHGCRFVISSNVQTFTSTTTVYPTLVMGANAYGVADWSKLENIYKPLGSGGTDDPLNQRATVGAKVDFVAKRLQESGLCRLESAATAV